MKKKLTAVIAGVCLLSLLSCKKQELVDPFWEINLAWDKKTVTNMLYDNSKRGKIENCVFSFEKEFYVKTKDMDVRVKASLDYPDFRQDFLKLLNYSLIAECKNETIPQFNPVFFQYFKNKMISSFGNISKEYSNGDTINLGWEIENNKIIEATIIKDINNYTVTIILK